MWGQKLPRSGVRRKQAASNPSHERNPDFLDVQSMALELGGGAGGSSEPGSTQQSRQQQPAAGPPAVGVSSSPWLPVCPCPS